MSKARINTQSGNAIILVLIGIVLFGALIFSFTRSGQQGISSMSAQEAKVIAQDVISYVQTIQRRIDELRRDGCGEAQFDLSDPQLYANGWIMSEHPGGTACNVFQSSGGTVPMRNFRDEGVIISWFSNYWTTNFRFFSASMYHSNTFGNGTELMFALINIDRQVCLEINNFLGVDNPGGEPPDATATRWGGGMGSYSTHGSGNKNVNQDPALANAFSACKYASTDGVHPTNYTFYHILIER